MGQCGDGLCAFLLSGLGARPLFLFQKAAIQVKINPVLLTVLTAHCVCIDLYVAGQ